jgi:ABC-type phosphate transport system substrate-binding protein
MKRFISIGVVALFLLITTAASDAWAGKADFVVITHPSNTVSAISQENLSRIFLKKITRWQDGTHATAVDQVRGAAARESFSKAVHNRSVEAIYSYWQNMIFSGRDTPPVELASDADVVAYVLGNPGSVGYVTRGALLHGAKELEVR